MRTATAFPTETELRAARLARGLSLTEAADVAGVDRATVFRAERDETSARIRRLLGASLGLPVFHASTEDGER
jgi:transcriptional regulator with XRE-family HTH domain